MFVQCLTALSVIRCVLWLNDDTSKQVNCMLTVLGKMASFGADVEYVASTLHCSHCTEGESCVP